MTLPIEDYALIGDCKTAASVGRFRRSSYMLARSLGPSMPPTAPNPAMVRRAGRYLREITKHLDVVPDPESAMLFGRDPFAPFKRVASQAD
jgi:hypothetical protein